MKGDPPTAHPDDPLQPLWLRAQSGDEAAYRAALALMARRLRAYFRPRMASHPDDLEDLVQDTLLAIHLKRDSYDPAFPAGAWLVAIAQHKLIDLWRRRGRYEARTDSIDALAPDAEPHTDVPTTPGVQVRLDLERLLALLPAAQRQAIELTRLEGLSTAEASARTGASESAIKVRVHRGLKRLADRVRGWSA